MKHVVAATALAPIAWGLTYVITTELLPPGRPLLTGVLRALPAGLVLAAVTRQPPAGAWWRRAAVLGTLNIGAFFALLFVAAYRLPGGVAATLGAVQPLLAAGLAAAVLGDRLHARTVGAGALGIAGVALLVLRAGARLDPVGVLAGLAGAASMATGVVLTKRWGRPVSLLAFTSWQLAAGGLVLTPVALVIEGWPPAMTTGNVLGYLWLATGGTAAAYALWFRGIDHLAVAQVSVLGLLSPVVATLAGWVVLNQTLGPAQVVGTTLVITAVWLGQRAAGSAGRSSGPPESNPAGLGIDLDPLVLQATGVLHLVSGHEPTGGCHDAPPRHRPVGLGEEPTDRPSRTRVPGLGGDFAVGHDLARDEPLQHGGNLVVESSKGSGHQREKSRSARTHWPV